VNLTNYLKTEAEFYHYDTFRECYMYGWEAVNHVFEQIILNKITDFCFLGLFGVSIILFVYTVGSSYSLRKRPELLKFLRGFGWTCIIGSYIIIIFLVYQLKEKGGIYL